MSVSNTRAAVIINPKAGAASRTREQLAEDAYKACSLAGLPNEVVFTEYRGHGRLLATEFARRGFSPIIAWGGDGTVNEVASALVFKEAVLGIVPSGSGNGLARDLGISLRPDRAIETVASGRDLRIDVGQLGDRYFVNIAGVGLAASVAYRFEQLKKRGLLGYLKAALVQLFGIIPETYQITSEGVTTRQTVLLVEHANGRQYGNGALIAPDAKLDDGFLELVIVDPIGPLRMLWSARRLFTGTINQDSKVRSKPVRCTRIGGPHPIRYHVDGEVGQGGVSLDVMIHPGALSVRVPTQIERAR